VKRKKERKKNSIYRCYPSGVEKLAAETQTEEESMSNCNGDFFAKAAKSFHLCPKYSTVHLLVN